MKTTCHTEYLKLQSVCLKPVRNSFVSQRNLNLQWEELNYLSEPNFDKAIKEYNVFEELFKAAGIEVIYLPKDDNVTVDSVYCRDASIATDFGMIICNMGKPGRINEPNAQKEDYLKRDISVLGHIKSPGTLEGGDVAWLDEKTLAVGHSYRTNEEGIIQLKDLLEPHGIEVIAVELPHYKGEDDVFHLMSILSPIDKDLAVVYSPLLPIKFRNQLLERGFKLVEVPDSEFETMGCNVLAIAPRHCIMVKGNPQTLERLNKAGCHVEVYAGKEISVKGGGGPTCLTRPLLRRY
jgi:N-dimethylarginine dimethylaminohydrolase